MQVAPQGDQRQRFAGVPISPAWVPAVIRSHCPLPDALHRLPPFMHTSMATQSADNFFLVYICVMLPLEKQVV